MRNIEERAKDIKVPDRYDLMSTDVIELIHMEEARGFDGLFDAIGIAFRIGFKRGRSYEKRHGERG